MSGVKSGSVPVAAIALAPLAVGAVVVAAAGGIVALAIGGAGAVITGMIRTTKECSERVNEYTENIIREESARINADLDKRKSNLENLLNAQPETTPNMNRLSELAAARETREVERSQKIIAALSQAKTLRETFEKKERLDPTISKRIDQQIAEFKLLKKTKEKEAQARREAIKLSAKAPEAQATQALHQRVREIVEAIRYFYPDVCEEVEKKLDECEKNASLNLRALATINRTYKLEVRARAVCDFTELLKSLNNIRLDYEGMIRYREENEYLAFQKIFISARDNAAQGLAIDGQLKKLQALLLQHGKQSEQRERNALHTMSIEKAKTSLVHCGYTKIRTTHNNRYRVLVGTASDGRKTTIKLALPGHTGDDIDPIRTEIDQDFYTKEQEDEWNAAGEKLVHQLKSEGLMIDFKEDAIEFKGGWASHAEQVLKDQARVLGYSEEQINSIEKIDEKRMSINGQNSECPATVDVKDFLRHAFDSGKVTKTAVAERQRERA